MPDQPHPQPSPTNASPVLLEAIMADVISGHEVSMRIWIETDAPLGHRDIVALARYVIEQHNAAMPTDYDPETVTVTRRK